MTVLGVVKKAGREKNVKCLEDQESSGDTQLVLIMDRSDDAKTIQNNKTTVSQQTAKAHAFERIALTVLTHCFLPIFMETQSI